MASIIDVTDISLGIGDLEFGYYDASNVFQGYDFVGAIKGTFSMQVTRETREFEAGRPQQELKSEVIRERVEYSFQMAEFRIPNLRLALGGGTQTDSVAPTFLDGTTGAPLGDLSDSVTTVVSANRLQFGGSCALDRVGLRFTHKKSCTDNKRQIIEAFIARVTGELTLPFNEEDWNMWTVTFRGISDLNRPAGARYFQILDEN